MSVLNVGLDKQKRRKETDFREKTKETFEKITSHAKAQEIQLNMLREATERLNRELKDEAGLREQIDDEQNKRLQLFETDVSAEIG